MPLDPLTAALIAVQENAETLRGAPGTKGDRGGPGKAGDPGLDWRGPWSTSETYAPGDAVELDGSSYVAVQPSKNQRPPSGVWDLLALKGAPGPPGRRGGGGGNAGGAGVSDHGALTGLADNDHPQYLTQAEGDAAYAPIGASALAVKDEGVSLDTAVTSIDVVGGTLTATAVGHAVTITGTGVANPLTADLLAGGFLLKGADAGGTGGRILAEDANGDDGGSVTFTGGTSADGNDGGSLAAGGGEDGGQGGDAALSGGNGAVGLPGGTATLAAGRGDNNNDERAYFRAYGGDGAGNAGRVEIQTDDDTGSSGDLLTAQGDGTALWVAPTFQASDATLTALSAANWAANAVPIGSGADALSQVAFAASTFPARASTGDLVAKTITDFGLSLIDDAAASNARTTLGLGTAAVAATGDFEAAGGIATHAAAADPHTGYLKENDASWVDLTDSGATTLHSHAGGSVTWISIARWGL